MQGVQSSSPGPVGTGKRAKWHLGGFGDTESMVTAPHVMGAPTWLCLAHEQDACCSTGSHVWAWIPSQKSQVSSQKTHPGPSVCASVEPGACYQGSVRNNTSKSPLDHQPQLPSMHWGFGFPLGGKEGVELGQRGAGGGKCSREELGKQRASL